MTTSGRLDYLTDAELLRLFESDSDEIVREFAARLERRLNQLGVLVGTVEFLKGQLEDK
jgi:hypothetical protein